MGTFQVPIFDMLYAPTSELLMVRLAELEREGRAADGAALFREAVHKLSVFFVPAFVFLMAFAPFEARRRGRARGKEELLTKCRPSASQSR